MNTPITQDRLKELLSYDQETGLFTWNIGRGLAKKGGIAGNITKSRAYSCIRIMLDCRSYKAHRLAWLYVYGEWPSEHIDHINGNSLDNRICNLREASVAINTQNQRVPSRANTTGFMGVRRRFGGWSARIKVSGLTMHLGTFDSPEDASRAYLEAKRKYHPGFTL